MSTKHQSSHLKPLAGMALAGLISACANAQDGATANNDPHTFSDAEEVEIALADRLDGTTSHYCIDIMGGGNSIKVEEGLQAHTCYSYKGALGKDQIFSTAQFAERQLYLPKFDVCASIANPVAGAKIDLASCDGSTAQQFTFSNDGLITPNANPKLCLTVADETTYGRSKKHQKKALTLQDCTTGMTNKQQWRTRANED